MKKIRTIIILILTAAMLFSLAACGSKNSKSDGSDQKEQSEETGGKGDKAEPEHDPGSDPASEKTDKDPGPDKDSDSKKDPSPEKEPEEEPEEGPKDEPEEGSEPEDEGDDSYAPDLSGEYSGSFSSATGTSLDLIVRWAAEQEADGSYTVTLGYYLDSYSLEAGGRDGNTLTVTTSSGTKEFSFSTGDIEKNTDEKTETFIGGSSIRLSAEELAAGADATVSWDFRGSYTGVDLPVVTASGVIAAY